MKKEVHKHVNEQNKLISLLMEAFDVKKKPKPQLNELMDFIN